MADASPPQVPLLVPLDPNEGQEQVRLANELVDDPEKRWATPAWRREPTSQNDPRKGR